MTTADSPPLAYVAGPLFTPAERAYLEAVAAEAEAAGLRTYLPHRDAGLAPPDRTDTRPFYDADIRALERSAVIVAVLNGPDVDSGTAFEIGYAAARGLPIVGVLEDTRVDDPKRRLNVMIGNACEIVDRAALGPVLSRMPLTRRGRQA